MKNWPWYLVLYGAIALQPSPPAQEEHAARHTQCDPTQLGRELRGEVTPGIPLPGGVWTGMSRSEARRAAPRLVNGHQQLELFPGVSFRARATFPNFSKPLSGVEFTGRSSDAPLADLTRRFGLPIRVDVVLRQVELPGGNIPRYRTERITVDKWCDGPLVYVLQRSLEEFQLEITAARLDT